VDGRQRLAWGRSPADALDALRLRLGENEMRLVVAGSGVRVPQHRLREYVHLLG
jgi:hypothetical protein